MTEAVRKAEAELDAATTRSALNAAAKRLMTARAALKRLQDGPAGASPRASRAGARVALPERLAVFAQIETRLLKLLDDPLGELLPGFVRGVFRQDPSQQGAAARDGDTDRELELRAKRAVIHRPCFDRSRCGASYPERGETAVARITARSRTADVI